MTDHLQRPVLTVYRRSACHICDEADAILQATLEERVLRGELIPAVRRVTIDGHADLEARYGALVPVFAIGADQLDLVVSDRRLRTFLDRVLPKLA